MQNSINRPMGGGEWLMLVGLSILWGGSFFFVEVALRQLPPLTIVLLRVSLAAAALWTVAALLGLRPPADIKSWRALLAMGAINNVLPFSLLVWGQTHIASGLAAILNATAPIFTVIVAAVLLDDERLTAAKLGGVIAGFAGVVLMIGTEALDGLGDNLLAQAAVLGAALSYAFAGVYGRRFRTLGMNPIVTAAGQVTASSLILLPIVLAYETPALPVAPSGEIVAAMLALGLLSTALAYILYFRILATAGATNLLLVAFLIPLSAVLLGSLVLGEILDDAHYLGLALIGTGLLAIDRRLPAWLESRARAFR